MDNDYIDIQWEKQLNNIHGFFKYTLKVTCSAGCEQPKNNYYHLHGNCYFGYASLIHVLRTGYV